MVGRDPIKVLVVDDSGIYRNLIMKSLSGEEDIQIIGAVGSGEEAIQFLRTTIADVITLDVEMPGLNGLGTLQKIQETFPRTDEFAGIGVIMVSAFTRKGADITIHCLENGAFDFITKPQSGNAEQNMESLRRQLLVKIRHYAISRKSRGRITGEISEKKIITRVPSIKRQSVFSDTREPKLIRAVLIGVSTGGPKALVKFLPSLSMKIDLPIFIVQHMPPTFTQSLAETLNSRCNHRVIEVVKEEMVTDRTVYLASGGFHLLVIKDASDKARVIINEEPPENGFRPSVDVLFRSAASVFGGNVVAIILTGMGNDGTRGIGMLKRFGALTIAQDEETSVVWGMPRSAIEAGYIDEILSIDEIPGAVERIVLKKREIYESKKGDFTNGING